ncbi:hypothetical protein NMY22_g19314 [Coprinellus aureogranulatus]|nr:hypothetical protein NMY22_g19314 [Coprinellus aureogranulatus]
MRVEINEKISRLTTELNDEVARLQAESNEKIERLRSDYQREVSALERAFSEERSHLNGSRNALSPVYRLPPEVLSRIFYLSLSTSQPPEVPSQINPYSRMHKESYYYSAGDGYESYDFEFWGGALDALQLCHICQYWRAVALGSPHLWSHIQVDRWTQPELLTFITENAKKAPIDLDLSWSSNIKAYDALLNFLEASTEQVESLAIRCYTPSLLTTEKSDVLQRLAALTRTSLKSLQLVSEA